MLWATLSHSQILLPTLQSKTDMWVIDERTRIGVRDRVKAQAQNPYPFCFSAAAALLWDQHRCTVDKKNCKTFPQTSMLAITPAGQKLPDNEINISEGGLAFLSLKKIIDDGFVESSKCSHPFSTNSPVGTYNIQFNIEAVNRHKGFAPYLERVYTKSLSEEIKKINPSFEDSKLTNLIDSRYTGNRLMGEILLTESCYKDVSKDERFKINLKSIKDEPDESKTAFNLIDQLLAKKYPVLVAFCIMQDKKDGNCRDKHTSIIIAKAKARHKVTGDVKTFYWMVNTWGEEWQEKNADGWVSAESLHNSLYGEVVWLEQK